MTVCRLPLLIAALVASSTVLAAADNATVEQFRRAVFQGIHGIVESIDHRQQVVHCTARAHHHSHPSRFNASGKA